MWQKELRELSSGIYNVLNSTSRRHQTVKQFVDGINGSDASIEANLCTVLQSVRGTKQFWYRQKVGNDKRIWVSNVIFDIFMCRV